MAHLSSKHIFLAVVVFCMTISCCKAQDAVQIVARAALCFDNHTVINNCLQQMGINTNGTTNGSSSPHGALSTQKIAKPNATAVFCNTPCFGHMTLMTNCIDGIMSNFQGYSSGLMQGVRAIFQMSCGIGNNNTANAAPPIAQGKMTENGSGGKTCATNGAKGLHTEKRMWMTMLLATMLLARYYWE